MNTNRFNPIIFMLALLLIAVGCLQLSSLNAQPSTDSAVAVMYVDTPPATSAATEIINLATKFPWLTIVLAVVGALRLLIKPIFTALHAYADATDSPKDNEWIAKVEDSKALRAVAFVLDYLGSVKLTRK